MAGDDRDGIGSSYNQRAQRARLRALRELARRHAEEFTTIHDEERAAVGLVATGIHKWPGGDKRYERKRADA